MKKGKQKAVVLLLSGAVAACSGGRVRELPTPTLAQSADASGELAEIRATWRIGTFENRLELRDRLERFLRRFPGDAASPLAHVYLALVYLDGGDLQRAERELATLNKLGPGATRDFAEVARAETERARGRPADALERLVPLAGKLIDRDARERGDEAIVLAALGARRDFEALAYMGAWLRNTEEHDKDSVRERIRLAVARMEGSVLVSALTAMRRKDGASGYGRDLQRIVLKRVAEIAMEQNDSKLALWLVDDAAGATLDDSTELLVSELATRQAGGTAFVGRTVGLVLPTGTSSLRDAAGDVARGLAWALELPRSEPTAGDETRLSTRDDTGRRGELESKLEELAAEGAGVIIAGLDEAGADRAVRWSEAAGVPVVTLGAPNKAVPRTHAFAVGEPVGRVLALLGDALVQRRETHVAIVADRSNLEPAAMAMADPKRKLELFQPAPCELEQSEATAERFPVEAWQKEKFRTWVVAGPESCSRALLREVGALDGALVALTLEATGRVERGLAATVLSAGAGRIPVLAEGPQATGSRTLARGGGSRPEPTGDRRPAGDRQRPRPRGGAAEIGQFIAAFGSVPTWRVALGRDAGLLVRQALRDQPLDVARTEDEVRRRRESVRQALLAAKGPFWTSESMGLDKGSHVLPRALRVVEVR